MSYIIPEKCIKYVKMYQPVIKYNYQLEQEREKKVSTILNIIQMNVIWFH